MIILGQSPNDSVYYQLSQEDFCYHTTHMDVKELLDLVARRIIYYAEYGQRVLVPISYV